ncbi:helix-turn-helix domain-containing protein [Deinococcus roseus]|uniref:HTH cro/C1-type domain-containing protein n=1 Tax=Deinococcus roseus TaxID=392414 RepID=A0ABQ2CV00_9DEIO|nr:helix-turn-helix domain-containing protein [Deinococcus roseus]GGJ23495.1 hypothetical protein GCM10008938_07040 [Deinococcus roseus]
MPTLLDAARILQEASHHTLKPLQNKEELLQAQSLLSDLLKAKRQEPSSSESLRPLIDVLKLYIQQYERQAYSHLMEKASPAEMLAYLLEEGGHTKRDIARATGIDEGNLSKLASGKRTFSLENVKRLSACFKVRPELFMA